MKISGVLLANLIAIPSTVTSLSFYPTTRIQNNPNNPNNNSNNEPQTTQTTQTTQTQTQTQLSSLPTAEADRAFRYATSCEQAGLPRTAHAAYHEAATLYHCFLDSKEFAHVTDLHDLTDEHVNMETSTGTEKDSNNSLRSFLAYSCMRLAFLSHDALDDPKAALRLYKEAVILDTLNPSSEAYDGIGTSIEAADGDLSEAVEAYRTALSIAEPDDSGFDPYDYLNDAGFVKFHLGVALERLGEVEEAEEIMETLRRCEAKYACLVDSWGYIRWHTRRISNNELNLYAGTRNMLSIGIDAAMDLVKNDDGLVCEFGVAQGRSLRMMQELLPLELSLHGFDTFTGLPIPWNSLPAGSFSTFGSLPSIEGDVYYHKGLFVDSIPEFLEGEYKPLAFANIDALLYASTLDILEAVHSRVVPGTVFAFADYCCHPTWRQDAFRAWRECCKRFGWTYEYLGFSLATKQVVVRVTNA